MATRLSRPVSRELSAEQISDLLGVPCNRPLVITVGLHGITFKAKGRKSQTETMVPWKDIISRAHGGVGLDQMRKDLR